MSKRLLVLTLLCGHRSRCRCGVGTSARRCATGPAGRPRRLRSGRDRTAGAGAAGSRDSAADAGRTGTGQCRAEALHRRRQVVDAAAAEEIRVADAAAAAADERRRDVYADQPAHGTAARRVRRHGQAGQHRSAPARRLDHRLVAAGREQADVRQVLRQHPDRQLRGRRRHDARRALGAQERRGPGLPAEGGDADDRDQQHRPVHGARDRGRRRRRGDGAAP